MGFCSSSHFDYLDYHVVGFCVDILQTHDSTNLRLNKRAVFLPNPKVSPHSVKKKKKSEMVIIHPNINKTTWWAHWKEKGLYWNGIGVCFADCVRTRSADGIFSLLIIKGFQGYSFWRLALCIYHLAAHCETAYISTTFASSAASQTCF